MLTNRTPEAHQWAVDRFRTLRSDGQFLPLAEGQNTILMPGFDGGAEWGGSAFDLGNALLYVNANDIAWMTSLVKNEGGTGARQDQGGVAPSGEHTLRLPCRRLPGVIP